MTGPRSDEPAQGPLPAPASLQRAPGPGAPSGPLTPPTLTIPRQAALADDRAPRPRTPVGPALAGDALTPADGERAGGGGQTGRSWRRAVRRAWDRTRERTRTGAGQPLLPTVRRVFLVFYLACLAIVPPQWAFDAVVPQRWSWPVLPALVGLGVWARRLHRGRTTALTDVLAACCLGTVVWAVGALPVGGVLFVGVSLRALHGRARGVVLSLALTVTAMTLGVLAAGGTLKEARLAQYAPGLLLTAGLLRFVLVVVERYETGASARFEAVVRSSRDVLIITDGRTVASYVSPALAGVFGMPEGRLPDGRLISWIVDADRPHARAWLARTLAVPGSATTFPCRVVGGDGEPVPVEVSAQNLLDDPNVAGLLFAVRDVTQRVMLTEKLRHQALHDPLTGLPNRLLLGDRLAAALAREGGTAALLLVDLDSFKAVNDTLGHAAGDELLVDVANRLGAHLQPGDTLARLGGDEFAVLLNGARADPAEAEQVAGHLHAALRRPVPVAGRQQWISASVGVAVGTAPVTGDQLMREADVALYRAKAQGSGRTVRYRPEVHEAAVDALRLQSALAAAVEQGELVLRYQPVLELATGRLAGFEALLRWDRPGHGLVPPGSFVPLAERSGLIVPIGAWVLAEACTQASAWQRRSGLPLGMNVNVSMHQIARDDLVPQVRAVLERTGLRPGTLTLEITESALAADDRGIESRLAQLRELGVRISLDDFGTGFNSLSYLQLYPLDELKIDRSFVARLRQNDPASVSIISAILAMGRSLDLGAIAEGIETEGQYEQLVALGVQHGQGFAFAGPLAPDEVGALLDGR